MSNILEFSGLTNGGKTTKEISNLFKKNGAAPVQVDVASSIKKSSGIAYKEVSITFPDSQVVLLRVKESGDIYQVLLNKKTLPIKNQNDQNEALKEIVSAMDAGRAKYQRVLAAAKVKIPAGIKTAAPTLEQKLSDKKQALTEAIELSNQELNALNERLNSIEAEG